MDQMCQEALKRGRKEFSEDFFTVEGHQTADREEWKEGLKKFILNRYDDPLNSLEAQRHRLKYWKRADSAECRKVNITMSVLLRAKADLHEGKEPSEDGVVMEMLNKLPWSMYLLILQAFVAHATSKEVENDESWTLMILVGLA